MAPSGNERGCGTRVGMAPRQRRWFRTSARADRRSDVPCPRATQAVDIPAQLRFHSDCPEVGGPCLAAWIRLFHKTSASGRKSLGISSVSVRKAAQPSASAHRGRRSRCHRSHRIKPGHPVEPPREPSPQPPPTSPPGAGPDKPRTRPAETGALFRALVKAGCDSEAAYSAEGEIGSMVAGNVEQGETLAEHGKKLDALIEAGIEPAGGRRSLYL